MGWRATPLLVLVAGGLASGCAHNPGNTAVACSQLLAGPSHSFTLDLPAMNGRRVPTEIFLPAQPGTYPLIAFSHGAFAAPERYRAMLEPIAASGFVVVAPMHVDSELYDHAGADAPDASAVWDFRKEDMRLALTNPEPLRSALAERGVKLDAGKTAAMGHSYGALFAQMAGGARATDADGTSRDLGVAAIDAVIAWSQPGPLTTKMKPSGWSSMAAPSMVITGTADVLPAFIDDWRTHKASFDNAPEGTATLWVGEGIDHYFGGMFGRERESGEVSRRLFGRAMEQTLAFMQHALEEPAPCNAGPISEGETLVRN